MFNHLDRGDTMDVDVPADGTAESDYRLGAAGRLANPDQLCTDQAAVASARSFFTVGKPWRPSATRPGP